MLAGNSTSQTWYVVDKLENKEKYMCLIIVLGVVVVLEEYCRKG